jgi:hypothetical protein
MLTESITARDPKEKSAQWTPGGTLIESNGDAPRGRRMRPTSTRRDPDRLMQQGEAGTRQTQGSTLFPDSLADYPRVVPRRGSPSPLDAEREPATRYIPEHSREMI